jgi:uncharacterized protein
VKIRTITVFDDVGFPVSQARLEAAGRTASNIRGALEEAGYEVQTVRLALPPVAPSLGLDVDAVVRLARDLEANCPPNGIEYATVGVVLPPDPPGLFEALPDAIGATTRVFASCLIASREHGLSLPAVRGAAEVIWRCSRLSPDGFGNLRFAALANVPPGVPFLPGAYHDGGPASVAIGVEAADLAVTACASASSVADARSALVGLIDEHAARIGWAAERALPSGVRFGGIDFSLAPFPEAARSVGSALERLSGVRVGEHGTLAATAVLADTLDRATFPRAGYSGVFLPVFEDAVLAARATERLLTTGDLLLWSSVCGTGLDTVPLPGDVSAAALAAILADLGALALRLDKPLTARLMPIPGKQAGDPVTFDFAYFAPSRVLDVRASGLGGLIGAADRVDLHQWRGRLARGNGAPGAQG